MVPEALRSAGYDVQIHDDHLAPDAPDEDWIALCGRKRWVAITQDKNIRYRAAEIDAIRRNGAAVFVVRAKLLTGDQLGELLVKYAKKLARFATANEPPFVAGIDRNGRISNYSIWENSWLVTRRAISGFRRLCEIGEGRSNS